MVSTKRVDKVARRLTGAWSEVETIRRVIADRRRGNLAATKPDCSDTQSGFRYSGTV